MIGPTDDQLREMIAAADEASLADTAPEMREHVERMAEFGRGELERRALKQKLLDEKESARDWDGMLILNGSEERAATMVRIADKLSDDEARDIIRHWWTSTEAWSGDPELRAGMWKLFDRATKDGLLTDLEEGEPNVVKQAADADRVLPIYRGNGGEDPKLGHAWSLDRETAEVFARQLVTPRGRLILGMNPDDDAIPSIWKGYVAAKNVRAYFNGRSEREIVVDPEHVFNVELIAEMEGVREKVGYRKAAAGIFDAAGQDAQ